MAHDPFLPVVFHGEEEEAGRWDDPASGNTQRDRVRRAEQCDAPLAQMGVPLELPSREARERQAEICAQARADRGGLPDSSPDDYPRAVTQPAARVK